MNFYQDQDKQVALHYADKLGNIKVQQILECESVKSKEEATILSKFYWEIVSASIKDRDSNTGEPFENMDVSLEGLHNTFSIYLCNNGFEDIWDEVLDEQ